MKKISISRYNNSSFSDLQDYVAEETLLRLNIGGKRTLQISLTPDLVREFVFGFVLSEGFVTTASEIAGLKVKKLYPELFAANVRLTENNERQLREGKDFVWSECGPPLNSEPESVQLPKIRVSPDTLLKTAKKIGHKAEEFKKTGAYHYASLVSPRGEILERVHDIGRHNAVDKVVGKQMLQEGKLPLSFLFTTGRISSDIVLKCARVGIPLVVSRSAPLLRAVELARKFKVGIVGFLRGKRFNLYSRRDFIAGDNS